MKPLPEFWTVYARHQKLLEARAVLDDTSWGLEEVLDHLSTDAEQPIAEDDLARIRQSRSRKERNQATLRRTRGGEASVPPDDGERLDARRRLVHLRRCVTEPELALLLAADSGVEHEALAASLGISVGCLRTRVCRLRGKLRDFLRDGGTGQAHQVRWSTAA